MRKPYYRTLAGILALGAGMVASLWLVPGEMRAGVAPAVVGALSSLGAFLAAKSYGEHREAAKAPAP